MNAKLWAAIGGATLSGAVSAAVMVWPAGAQQDGARLLWQDTAVVAEGAALYVIHCAACHGAELEGQPDWRVRLENGRLPAPPHDETGHTWHHPDEILVAITTHGTAALMGGDYESDMIGFGDVLTGYEIVAVLSYIKSTWPEQVIEIHEEINARHLATR